MIKTAIIADDETVLRAQLKTALGEVWPQLNIVGEAKNGLQAVTLIRKLQPDIAFLDIRMPGLTGLQVATQEKGACEWVFVTAFDQYAIDAFDNAAIDYLLKPVSSKRLRKTVLRLQNRSLNIPQTNSQELSAVLNQLLKNIQPVQNFLQWLPVSQQEETTMLCVDDVDYFHAEDKYTVVVTSDEKRVIRRSIKELEQTLDPDKFWRIHRATIVRVAVIEQLSKEFRGRHLLKLQGHQETLTVSRSYAHRFKQT